MKVIRLTTNDGTMEFEAFGDLLSIVQCLHRNNVQLRVKGSEEWGLPDWAIWTGPNDIIETGNGCEGDQCET
jgi:hypothetical protein